MIYYSLYHSKPLTSGFGLDFDEMGIELMKPLKRQQNFNSKPSKSFVQNAFKFLLGAMNTSQSNTFHEPKCDICHFWSPKHAKKLLYLEHFYSTPLPHKVGA